MDVKRGQIIALVVFGFFAALGLIVLSSYTGDDKGETIVPITIWGTIEKKTFDSMVSNAGFAPGQVTYRAFRDEDFDQEFIEALARDETPDAVLISDARLFRHRDKFVFIPYTSINERQYKESFVQGTEVYLEEEGSWAIPALVDPMVMYWNRSIFTAGGVLEPPKYWDEFVDLENKLTRTESAFNVTQSAVALGEYSNIDYSKEILTSLIMQVGVPIIQNLGGSYSATLDHEGSQGRASDAVNFYTQFANPARSTYTWNRSFSSSQDAFLAGDLAIYFGTASEYADLQLRNPNLDFEVAPFPQIRDTDLPLTYGHVYGLSFPRKSANVASAFVTVFNFSKIIAPYVYDLTRFTPVTKSELAMTNEKIDKDIAYTSAVIARSWLDPNPESTDLIFKRMIEEILAGEDSIPSALGKANASLDLLLKNE